MFMNIKLKNRDREVTSDDQIEDGVDELMQVLSCVDDSSSDARLFSFFFKD
ncbi:hypothetical protein RchiOBHm_Chr1g0315861 [Rosa chinensis]|uniref:Uncharacterized protein n=1 Tax=Rosa chinensis TaxID=74649 RepID=A0A2P6S7L8_ROSCH|nr:hypothetical protein RchiOBHm_Chr1g0315861 [Rosa chinensis]